MKKILNEKRRYLGQAVLALALFQTSLGHAATITWTGATDTDFNTDTNWSTVVPGTADVANFTGAATANPPQLSGAVTILGITFDTTAVGYTLSSSGPALTLTQATAISSSAGSGTNSISADLVMGGVLGGTQLITRNSTNGTLVLSGVISGTDATSAIRFGSSSTSGTLTISGTNNSYLGNTLITGTGTSGSGIVAVASIGNTGANSSVGAGSIVNIGTGTTGGILRYTGAGETLGVSGKTINLNGTTGGATIDTTGNTGALIVGAGRLTFGGSGNKTLTLSGSSTLGDTIAADIVDSTGGITTLTKSGTGTWILTGTNTYTGNTNISGGSLSVSNVNQLGAGTLNIGSSTNGGGLIYTGGAAVWTKTVNLNGTTGGATINTTGASGGLELTSMTVTGAGAKTLGLSGDTTGNQVSAIIADNTVANTTAVSKSGTGTWTLSGVNTYSGGTTINTGGRLGVANDDALGTGSVSFAAAGNGELFASGSDVVLDNNFILVRATTGSSGTTGTFSGIQSITINGNVSAAGNSQSGGVSNRGIANNISGAGKTLTINGDYISTAILSASGNSLTFSGTGDTIFNGAIHDSTSGRVLGVTYAGTGSLTLAGNSSGAASNPLTGTMVLSGAGKVNINHAGALSSGALTLGGSTIDNTSGAAITLNSVSGITMSSDFTFGTSASTSNNNLSFSAGNIVGWTGTRTITMEGTGTTLDFAGNLSAPTDNSRTLAVDGVGNTASFGGATITTVSTSRTLTVSGSANVIFKGAVSNGSGAGSVVYGGSGTLTLEGANTYTGSTTVNGTGIMLVSGSLTTSSVSVSSGTFKYTGSTGMTQNVTVGAGALFSYNGGSGYTGTITNNGGKIGGSGTFSTALVFNSTDDVLAPGNSPGIMTSDVNQTWSSYTYEWEVNDFTGLTAGTDFDQVAFANLADDAALTLDGGLNAYVLEIISLDGLDEAGLVANFAEVDRQWTIMTAEGGISGFDADNWSIDDSGFANSYGGMFSLSSDANNIYLNYTAVPEPSTYAMVGLGLASLWFLRRKRCRTV